MHALPKHFNVLPLAIDLMRPSFFERAVKSEPRGEQFFKLCVFVLKFLEMQRSPENSLIGYFSLDSLTLNWLFHKFARNIICFAKFQGMSLLLLPKVMTA